MKFKKLHTDTREEWLELRKGYLTATEIAAIGSGSEKSFRTLWEQKHGLVKKSFRGNAATEWGNEREPEIVKLVQQRYPSLEHNTDFCVSLDDERIGCTPDMITPDGSFACQIKTVVESRDWLGKKKPIGYRRQAEWELLTLGLDSYIFAVETYRETPLGFEPTGFRVEEYESDPKLRAQCLEVAEKFWAYSPEDYETTDDEFIKVLTREYVLENRAISDLNKELGEHKKVRDELAQQLLAHTGTNPRSLRVGDFLLSVTLGKQSERFDRKGFEADHPELAKKYTLIGEGKTNIKVGEL